MVSRSSLVGPKHQLVILLAGIAAGCSSRSSAELEDRDAAAEPADAADIAQHASPIAGERLDLAVPDDGFQLRSAGAEIGPGEDVEYCEIGELPGEPSETYYVRAIDLANATFSHHLVIATAEPGSAADAVLRGLEVGDRVRCNGANFEWPQEGLTGLVSSQTQAHSLEFPDGVGTILHGNQRFVFDYHYLNTGEQAIRAESAVNVHLVDGASIEHVATAFSFFNFTVDVPAASNGAFTAECHFKDDVKLARLVRHTHQQGRDFSVWWSGGPSDGELIWTSHDWKHETDFPFEEPVTVPAGEGFRFECDFENSSDARLRYGIRGTDEMCILAGWIWTAGTAIELPDQNCAITWVDADGIGHPASEAGGFPPATPSESGLCHAGLQLVGETADSASAVDCDACICDACGSVMLRCGTDADCKALVECLHQDCGTQAECVHACEQELHDHSSAVGLLQQVNSCLASRCGECVPASD